MPGIPERMIPALNRALGVGVCKPTLHLRVHTDLQRKETAVEFQTVNGCATVLLEKLVKGCTKEERKIIRQWGRDRRKEWSDVFLRASSRPLFRKKRAC